MMIRKVIQLWILVLWGFFMLPTDARRSANICRDKSLAEEEPIADADIIVIGSGPGGTGFLYRFIQKRPNMSVLWIEKGRDFLARNWPKDILDVDAEILSPIPRLNKKLRGYAWNNYGGGDSGNSGGPNYLGLQRPLQEPYQPVDVLSLRNHSIIPNTTTTRRWIEAFSKAGYDYRGPIYSRQLSEGNGTIGLVSSLRTSNGRERLLLADDIRYNTDNNVTFVHARVTSIIHDKNPNKEGPLRMIGVRGVRIAGDQSEYGGCVTWKAHKAVILAGGVFNSFDILVESGLGPQEALDIREVPKEWRYPNEQVGKGIGDEFPMVYVSVEPEKQDQFGAEPRLAADTPVNGTDASYEMWSHGIFAWLRLENPFYNNLLGSFIPKRFPGLNFLIRKIVDRASMFSVSVFVEPNMSLIATKKPQNATSSPNNPLGMKLNDTMINITDEMCMNYTKSLEPFKEGAKLQKQAPKKPSFARFVFALTSKLGITKILQPNPITAQNIHRFTGKGKNKGRRCRMSQVASYYHFYGGNAYAVNASSYIMKDTQNLYISDASIIKHLAVGGPSSVVFEQGMKVADVVNANL